MDLGKTFEEHLENLKQVCSWIKHANLPLKLKNDTFSSRSNLEHIISFESIKIHPEKISTVLDWQEPTNKTKLRSFLELFYYRRVVKGLAEIARLLHRSSGHQHTTIYLVITLSKNLWYSRGVFVWPLSSISSLIFIGFYRISL